MNQQPHLPELGHANDRDAATRDAAAKEAELRARLASMDAGVLVAFSAGVDSTYLLAVAHDVLGDRCAAVTADSPSLARSSLDEARAFCAARGIRHVVVATDEFERAAYVENTGARCYECKAALLRAMHGIDAATRDVRGPQALLLGAIAEDFGDVRPGLEAARRGGAAWPMADCGFTKADVRARSRAMGLPTADRPAEPCLSSRFPYGEPVSHDGLRMIEAAERIVRRLGVRDCRARHHRVGAAVSSAGTPMKPTWMLRIEVPADELPRVLAARDELLPLLTAVGYAFVSLDLAGLRSGGFNAQLAATPVLPPDAPMESTP